MMPPRVKPHFEQGVPLGMAYGAIVQYGPLAVFHLSRVRIGFVLPLVAREPVLQRGSILLRGVGHDGVVGLLHAARAEHLVEPRQRLSRPRKHHNAAHWAVEPVHHAEKHVARFLVFLFNIKFYLFR